MLNVQIFRGVIEHVGSEGLAIKFDSLIDHYSRAVAAPTAEGWEYLDQTGRLEEGVVVQGFAKASVSPDTMIATRIYNSILNDQDRPLFNFSGIISKTARFNGGQDAIVKLDPSVGGYKYAVIHHNSIGQHELIGQDGRVTEGLVVRGKGFKQGEALLAMEIAKVSVQTLTPISP